MSSYVPTTHTIHRWDVAARYTQHMVRLRASTPLASQVVHSTDTPPQRQPNDEVRIALPTRGYKFHGFSSAILEMARLFVSMVFESRSRPQGVHGGILYLILQASNATRPERRALPWVGVVLTPDKLSLHLVVLHGDTSDKTGKAPPRLSSPRST